MPKSDLTRMAKINMHQEEFQKLLRKYNNGLCTPEEVDFVEKWFEAMGSSNGPSLSTPEKADIRQRSWTRVQEHIRQSATTEAGHSRNSRKLILISAPFLSIAAAILLMLVSVVFVLVNSRQKHGLPSTQQIADKNISNSGPAIKEVLLSDGSQVLLEPNSSISFREPFDSNERLVTLEGEAFFRVARNVSRPFLVNTNEVITKVLGTSFTVSAFPNEENITVSVKTGKVSVITRSDIHTDSEELKETILTPNQKIIYNKSNHIVSRALVQEPVQILPPAQVKRMQFEAAPMREIFEGLEQVYGVDIDFDENTFSSCFLTTSIVEGNIYNRLDMICKAIDAQYTVIENVIVITGKGCKH